jgi:hypothetical protein
MKQIRSAIAIFCLLQSICSNAQNFRDDYKKMQDAYASLDRFSCDLKIKTFEHAADSKASAVMSAALRKQGDNYSYFLGRMKMIMNDDCLLFIDEAARQMTYTIRNKKKEAAAPQMPAFAIDTLIKKSDSVICKGLENGKKHYIAYSSKGLILSTELFINTETNLLENVIYHYDAKRYSSEKVEIDYCNMQLHPEFAADEFSEKNMHSIPGES